MKPIKVGILGAGGFARAFTPLFKAHPQVRAVSLTEILPERRRAEAALAGVTETYGSLDELLASDCDAVAIFTQRWMHAPQAIAALRAGKHVYSAVPAGTTPEELVELVETVKRTGLIYMMGETSYYYPSTIFCREMWRQGRFGRFVYGEGEYMHDMSHGFYQAYQHSGGADWKRTAGVPPMLYPTHTVSMIVSVTGARMTRVSCLGPGGPERRRRLRQGPQPVGQRVQQRDGALPHERRRKRPHQRVPAGRALGRALGPPEPLRHRGLLRGAARGRRVGEPRPGDHPPERPPALRPGRRRRPQGGRGAEGQHPARLLLGHGARAPDLAPSGRAREPAERPPRVPPFPDGRLRAGLHDGRAAAEPRVGRGPLQHARAHRPRVGEAGRRTPAGPRPRAAPRRARRCWRTSWQSWPPRGPPGSFPSLPTRGSNGGEAPQHPVPGRRPGGSPARRRPPPRRPSGTRAGRGRTPG